MFYKYPRSNIDIRQGDIFINIPFSEIDLDKIEVVTQAGKLTKAQKWEKVKDLDNLNAKINVINSLGIVVSQNCDNLRNDFISFAMLQPLVMVTNERSEKPLGKIKSFLRGPIKSNYQWFYLPEDIRTGFKQKMAVNFDILFQIPKDSLLKRRSKTRIATLSSIALAHFRNSLINYFTRYALNEWYSLSKDEFKIYKEEIVKKSPEEEKYIIPYPHQK